jgi:hypothetical protein
MRWIKSGALVPMLIGQPALNISQSRASQII